MVIQRNDETFHTDTRISVQKSELKTIDFKMLSSRHMNRWLEAPPPDVDTQSKRYFSGDVRTRKARAFYVGCLYLYKLFVVPTRPLNTSRWAESPSANLFGAHSCHRTTRKDSIKKSLIRVKGTLVLPRNHSICKSGLTLHEITLSTMIFFLQKLPKMPEVLAHH